MSNEEKAQEEIASQCDEKPEIDPQIAIRDIIKNYRLLESSVVSQLNFGC